MGLARVGGRGREDLKGGGEGEGAVDRGEGLGRIIEGAVGDRELMGRGEGLRGRREGLAGREEGVVGRRPEERGVGGFGL